MATRKTSRKKPSGRKATRRATGPRPTPPGILDVESLPWHKTRVPGISLCVLRNDERTRDAVVFIRMKAGSTYPRHRHVGNEEVLVVQGGYRDDRGEYRAGTFLVNPAGSIHTPVALDGPPCVLFAIAHRGIEIVR